MDSTQRTVDPELLGALVDGRLSAEDRARVMKQLAESDDALAALAHLVQGLPSDEAPKVVPISSAKRWKRVLPFAAAAALLFLAVSLGEFRGTATSSAVEFASAVTAAERRGTPLEPGWEQRAWTVLRGGAGSREPSRASREQPMLAFRLGVRSVDVQVALAHGDAALAARLVDDMVELLKAIGFSEMVAAQYSTLRESISTESVEQSADKASRSEKELGAFLKSFPFDFGKWVAAAELAARSRDTTFFTDKGTQRFIGRAVNNHELTKADVDALHLIAARTVAGLTSERLEDVRGVLQEIIRRRGG